jgi:hypothetical protein
MLTALLGSLGCVSTPPSALALPEQRGCSIEMAIKAEESLATLGTWKDLFESFLKYAPCDDAGIGEGYSDVVMRLLTDQWQEIADVQALILEDASFEGFILQHIDDLASEASLMELQEAASNHCPKDALDFCVTVATRIRAVLCRPL